MSRLVWLLVTPLLGGGLSGCWVKKTMCRGLHNAMPDTCSEFTDREDDGGGKAATIGVASGGQPILVLPKATVEELSLAPGHALARITPEQLGKDLRATVNFGQEFEFDVPEIGQRLDYLILGFGVPLGGIDFRTAARRDRQTKAQTLLVARVIAWQLAGAALWKEHDTEVSARQVFTKCTLETDRPYQESDATLPLGRQVAIREGETRWAAQVDEFFFRFYARPPTPAELEAVKSTFLAGYNNEGYAPAGWIPVLYAMLASQEFWHL